MSNIIRFLYYRIDISNKDDIFNLEANGTYYYFWIMIILNFIGPPYFTYMLYINFLFIYNDISYYEDMNLSYDYECYYPFYETNNMKNDVYNKLE